MLLAHCGLISRRFKLCLCDVGGLLFVAKRLTLHISRYKRARYFPSIAQADARS